MENKAGDSNTMTKELNFIWIDDSRQRSFSAESLSRNLKVKVRFVSVEKKSILDDLTKIFGGSRPDLILIDHKLSKTALWDFAW